MRSKIAILAGLIGNKVVQMAGRKGTSLTGKIALAVKQDILNDFAKFKNDLQFNIEIIFDTNSFTYSEIIAFMCKHKDVNITFKNYIPNSNYIIGSNNAIDRGEIIHVKN